MTPAFSTESCVCAETSARNCPVHAPRDSPQYLRRLADERGEIERLRAALLEHHNIENVSEKAIRETYAAAPFTCAICRTALREHEGEAG